MLISPVSPQSLPRVFRECARRYRVLVPTDRITMQEYESIRYRTLPGIYKTSEEARDAIAKLVPIPYKIGIGCYQEVA